MSLFVFAFLFVFSFFCVCVCWGRKGFQESLGSALATVQVFVNISDSCSEHILVLESTILDVSERLLAHRDGKAHRMAAQLYKAYSIALPIVYENGPPQRLEVGDHLVLKSDLAVCPGS